MPFCANCGTRIEEDSHFCVGCGKARGNGNKTAAMAALAVAPAPEPLAYTIQGENPQVVRIRLQPGQEVFAAAERMIYKFPEVQWESRMAGQPLGDTTGGALTYFSATSPSEVGFAGAHPGRIQAFDLKAGQSVLVQHGSFVCAQSTARLDIAPVKNLGAGFSGREAFALERLTGPGTVFIHAGGDFIEFNLNPGQVLQVNTGCIVAFDDSVGYDMQLAGGEGMSLTTLTGPGRVVMQSMTIEKMRRELPPFHSGANGHGITPSLIEVLESED